MLFSSFCLFCNTKQLFCWVSRRGIISIMTWGCFRKDSSNIKLLIKASELKIKASDFRQLSGGVWGRKLREWGKALLSPSFCPTFIWWLYLSCTFFTCTPKNVVLFTRMHNLGGTSSMWRTAVNSDIFQESEIWHLNRPGFLFRCPPGVHDVAVNLSVLFIPHFL